MREVKERSHQVAAYYKGFFWIIYIYIYAHFMSKEKHFLGH